MLTYPAEWSGRAQVVVFDMTGRPVFGQRRSGLGLLDLELSHLAPGLYLIQLNAFGRTIETIKLTVQR